MRWIYISPHLDDAVLSAGGLIYDQTKAGTPVEIWTIMCGVPQDTELSTFAQTMHYLWGTTSAEETIRIRRAEDEKAADMVGAKTAHFDFLDCLYRRGRNGEWLYSDVFVPPHEDDVDLPRQIAETVTPRIMQDDVLVCPLALGSHVDHLLVRQAMEILSCPLFYYADIPYLLKYPDTLSPNTAGMKETVYPVSETGLRSWLEAVSAYSSQISTLFDSSDHMQESIRRYCDEDGGIHLYADYD